MNDPSFLRLLAETAVSPRDALRAFFADVRVATEETALAFLRGDAKRLRKYLADLVHEGSLVRNQSGAYVFAGWRALPIRRYPAGAQGTVAFGDDVANAMMPSAHAAGAPAPSAGAARAPAVSIDPDRIEYSIREENLSSNRIESIERELWQVLPEAERSGPSAEFFERQLRQAPERVESVLKNYRQARPWTRPGHNPGAWMNRALRNAL